MQRSGMLERLFAPDSIFDLLIIGGGATGIGIALDAAARGYSVALAEKHDLGKGTSSRSTKLIHGGVRYLRQGNFSLVYSALRERSRLLQNAPHLVKRLPIVIPCYNRWDRIFYGTGLKLYDLLAAGKGIGSSKFLSYRETITRLPTLKREGLRGGVCYFDAQFNDARLLFTLASNACRFGATICNYVQAVDLIKRESTITGALLKEVLSGTERQVQARAVINATGAFCDSIRRMDVPEADPMIRASQGIHLVLPARYLPQEAAVLIPETEDERVVFLIPWQDRVLVGTTETQVEQIRLEPKPRQFEVDYLLEQVRRLLTLEVSRADVLSVFAGLRPLVGNGSDTASISRDHHLFRSASGLITITGGKWTTYRQMAEETVNLAIEVAGLEPRAPETRRLSLDGQGAGACLSDGSNYCQYGAYAAELAGLVKSDPALGEPFSSDLPVCAAHVVWGVREEMATTLEDVLARRTSALFQDARASVRIAPAVASVMAGEMGKGRSWEERQVAEFCELADNYILKVASSQ